MLGLTCIMGKARKVRPRRAEDAPVLLSLHVSLLTYKHLQEINIKQRAQQAHDATLLLSKFVTGVEGAEALEMRRPRVRRVPEEHGRRRAQRGCRYVHAGAGKGGCHGRVSKREREAGVKRISREEAQRCLAAERRGESTEVRGRREAGGGTEVLDRREAGKVTHGGCGPNDTTSTET